MSWCDITVGNDAESCLTQAIEYNCRATCHAAWPDAGYCSGGPSSGTPPGTLSSPPPPSPAPPSSACEDLQSWCSVTVGNDADSCLTQAIEYNCRATCHAAWPDAGFCPGASTMPAVTFALSFGLSFDALQAAGQLDAFGEAYAASAAAFFGVGVADVSVVLSAAEGRHLRAGGDLRAQTAVLIAADAPQAAPGGFEAADFAPVAWQAIASDSGLADALADATPGGAELTAAEAVTVAQGAQLTYDAAFIEERFQVAAPPPPEEESDGILGLGLPDGAVYGAAAALLAAVVGGAALLLRSSGGARGARRAGYADVESPALAGAGGAPAGGFGQIAGRPQGLSMVNPLAMGAAAHRERAATGGGTLWTTPWDDEAPGGATY